ncbi:MAG: hypothetical protein ACYSWO_28665 [Planctomycetota bacterium]|jgi:hypothetical protein
MSDIEYKRGRRANTSTAIRMVYESRCGQYKVEKHTEQYGGGARTRWYALVKRDDVFRMIQHMKTYRTRRAAEKVIAKWHATKKG